MLTTSPVRAIAFDAFGTLFDVYSVSTLAEQCFPGQGDALADLWRRKQIEYALLRTLGNRYESFWEVTCDALDFAAAQLRLPMTKEARVRLLDQYAHLSPFPENIAALNSLRDKGLPLAILSNGTAEMLAACVENTGMAGLFERLLSVDTVKQYKPHPDAYQLGPDAFGCSAKEIVFVSSNGWDIAGANWFGYTTFWLNRSGQSPEVLDSRPAFTGSTLKDLVAALDG